MSKIDPKLGMTMPEKENKWRLGMAEKGWFILLESVDAYEQRVKAWEKRKKKLRGDHPLIKVQVPDYMYEQYKRGGLQNLQRVSA